MKLVDRFKEGDIVEVISMHATKEPHNNNIYTHEFMRVPLRVLQVWKSVYSPSNHYVYLNADLIEATATRKAGYNIVFGAVKIRKINYTPTL